MRISIREIKDYLRCPLYYKLKNVDELPVFKTLDEYFSDYFKLALFFYYFSLLDKKKKSVEGMMKRWEELWFSADMLGNFSEEELRTKSNEAVILVNDFIKKYGTETVTPIAVNFQYEAIFEGTENLHVTGEVDLIKILNDRSRKNETCICSFSLRKSYPDLFLVKNDIALSIASYAFRSNFKSQEDKIIINNIRCAEDTPTLRTGNDFVRAEKIIRNICAGISNRVFYPAPNNISCSNCPFRILCLNEKSVNTRGNTNGSKGPN